METKIVCCFTGHRPQSLPFRLNEKDERCIALREKLKVKIEQLITEENVTCFISGMALGVDQICAELVLELKEQHPKITLECAIPCEEQAVNWTEPQRDRYFWIAEQCDKETMLQHHYDKDCMMKRNRYMVDASQVILAVWNGKPSGTANTVKYAQEQGNRKVQYAEKKEIQDGIIEKYHPESVFDVPPVSEKANRGGKPHGDEQQNIFDEVQPLNEKERRKRHGGASETPEQTMILPKEQVSSDGTP